ncbi:hypothetical protein [Sebaldella sp. S0638]|uniref:hypothetical protein n=1 Tax=Sebaldella sp. S0638 TaxID=2957809 RepID=UPI00209CC1B2|nr:hypothetical protein [Sebaldella sp. S0638]MCP1226426.1 hypothetical protein [Sebaldella sp. S0638]
MEKKLKIILVILVMLFKVVIINATQISEQESKKQKERETILQSIYEKYNENKVSFRNLTIDESMILLKNSNGVDSSGVGIAGEKPLTRWAFENISYSEELLTELFLTSETVAGKVYALLGMKCLDEKLYEEYREKINLEQIVGTQIGCMVMGMSVEGILESGFDVECSVIKNTPTVELETGKIIINDEFDLLPEDKENKFLNKKTLD